MGTNKSIECKFCVLILTTDELITIIIVSRNYSLERRHI